jgi:hypothetical protein
MAKIVEARAGPLVPTAHAKRLVALAMYRKGGAFLASAGLLHRHKGERYVVLHLLCQGLEIVMKGLLLLLDYDKFEPQLRDLGHNLLRTTDTALKAAGLPIFDGEARTQLIGLNALYSKHLLRYASNHDVLVDASTIPFARVLHRVVALTRLLSREHFIDAKAI